MQNKCFMQLCLLPHAAYPSIFIAFEVPADKPEVQITTEAATPAPTSPTTTALSTTPAASEY